MVIGGRFRGSLWLVGLLLGSRHGRETHAQGTVQTVSDVQSQLLISDGIALDSTIRVFDDLASFLDAGESANLTVPHAGGATVSSSVLLTTNESKQPYGDTQVYTTATECCQRRDCVSQSVKPKVQELITWNLAADGVSVLQSAFVLYESGDCSNPASLSSMCCLITCRNCYLALDIDSLSFEYATSPYRTAGEVAASGQGSLNFAVVAPNGCSTPNVIDKIRIPMSTITAKKWRLTLALSLQLTHQNQLTIQPHTVSDVVLGSAFRVNSFRGGFANTATSVGGTIDFSTVDTPKQASLDMAFRAGLAFQVTASVGFLDSAASIRVGVKSGVFLNAASSVDVSSQFPLRTQASLSSTSANSTGDCRAPHFMEYAVSSVVDDAQLLYGSALVSRDVDGDATKNVSSFTTTKHQESGCVATAYTARFKLSVQLSVVQALIDDSSRKSRLLRALPRGLSFLDLDPAMITILSISSDDSTVEVEIALPPSIQAGFADAVLFASECNVRAKTDKFKRLVSAALATAPSVCRR